MNTAPSIVNSKTPSNTSDSDSKASETFRTTKILEATGVQLERLMTQANGSGPKRVQRQDIIHLAVSKVSKSDLDKLRQEKMTPSDRFEEMCENYIEKNPGSTRESFLESLLKNATVPSLAVKEVKNG